MVMLGTDAGADRSEGVVEFVLFAERVGREVVGGGGVATLAQRYCE
jgi:hypothetical protein